MAVGVVPPQGSGPPRWPVLRLIDTVFTVREPNTVVHVQLPLVDRGGRVRYTLHCRGGNEPFLPDVIPEALWIPGAFACRLNPDQGEDERTLLVSDESPYWHTDGLVWYHDLATPERRVRTFRLRGFQLVLRFETAIFEGERLRRVDLRVSVRPDARITSSWVETGQPRMCRNWTDRKRLGSWEECQ